MKILAEVTYGSHLYGLETPESDKDFKGVYLPSFEDVVLGTIRKSIPANSNNSNSKNTSEDVDCEYYSLQHFLNLACQGETVALDMLHAPDNMVLKTSNVWETLRGCKHEFYSKNMRAFIGYAKTQAHKYGKKGARLKSALSTRDNLVVRSQTYMDDIWDKDLYLDDNVRFVNVYTPFGPKMFYEVCGRKIEKTLSIINALDIIDHIIAAYGERSKEALEGTDWKAMSHAVRVLDELYDILTVGTIRLPLPEETRYRVSEIKAGRIQVEWITEYVDRRLEEVDNLLYLSTLPSNIDRKSWDAFIVKTYSDEWEL